MHIRAGIRACLLIHASMSDLQAKAAASKAERRAAVNMTRAMSAERAAVWTHGRGPQRVDADTVVLIRALSARRCLHSRGMLAEPMLLWVEAGCPSLSFPTHRRGIVSPRTRPITSSDNYSNMLNKCCHAGLRASRTNAGKMLAKLLPAAQGAGQNLDKMCTPSAGQNLDRCSTNACGGTSGVIFGRRAPNSTNIGQRYD